MTLSVGACVISRDDELQLRLWLESLSWADEAVAAAGERSREAAARRQGA